MEITTIYFKVGTVMASQGRNIGLERRDAG